MIFIEFFEIFSPFKSIELQILASNQPNLKRFSISNWTNFELTFIELFEYFLPFESIELQIFESNEFRNLTPPLASARKNNFSNPICVSFGIRRAFMCTTLLRNTTRGSHSGCNYVRAKSFQQSQLLLLAKILSSSSCQKGVLATLLLIIYCIEKIEAKTLWALALDGTKKMPISAKNYFQPVKLN